jgi:hypothetical protein
VELVEMVEAPGKVDINNGVEPAMVGGGEGGV